MLEGQREGAAGVGVEQDMGLGICLASFGAWEEGKEVMPGVRRCVVVALVTFPKAEKPLCHQVGLTEPQSLMEMQTPTSLV